MTVHTQDRASVDYLRPPLTALLARARALRPTLAAEAAATEQNRRVSEKAMLALEHDQLLSLTKPARFGGFEYGPSALVLLGYELGQACGSTAWCATLANCNSWFASYWPLEAQQEVWRNDPDALIAAPLAPTGHCEQVDGGFLLSGRWPFASNCDNSDWAITSAVVYGPDGIPSGPAWFLVPMTSLSIDQDTWHMSGLQGSGSKTLYADEPVFVPEDRHVRLSDIVHVTTPGTAIENNTLARFSWSTFGSAALVGPLLGMARGALDWYVSSMAAKVRPGSATNAAQDPFVQERAGRASVYLDAALALLLKDLSEAEDVVFAGGHLDDGQRIRLRRDFGYAAGQAVAAVNELYGGAGASSAALHLPIQRFWRDVNMAAGHVSLNERSLMALAGQQLLGLPLSGGF